MASTNTDKRTHRATDYSVVLCGVISFLKFKFINMNNSITFQKDIKRFYISGRISGLDFKFVNRKFQIGCEEVQLYHQADYVINPLTIKPFLGIKKWLFYMINDIRAQRKCTHTAFLSNWKDSKGAVIEYFFAKFIFKHGIVFL